MHKYRPPARALHWIVAALVVAAWPLGAVIKFVREDVKLTFYMFHESIGFIILWLMLARLAYRLANPPPPLTGIPVAEARLAGFVHAALYVCLLAQPVTGFLATNAHGFPLHWFWLVPVASPIGKSPDVAPLLSAAHVVFGWAILVLFALHLAGVVRHTIRGDRIVERMI